MWLMLVVAGFLSILVLTSVFSDYSGRQVDTNATQIGAAATSPTMGDYNAFAYGALLYMRDIPAIPAVDTVVKWTAIKTEIQSRGLSVAFLDAGVPDTWKIVATGEDLFSAGDKRGFFVCADMPEESAAALVRKVPGEFELKVFNREKVVSGTNVQLAVLSKDTAEADKGEAKCTK